MTPLECIRRGDSEVSDHRKECLNTGQLTSEFRTQPAANAPSAFPSPEQLRILSAGEQKSLTNVDPEFDHQVRSILEPLSAALTGREAIRQMLERIVSADSGFAPGTHSRQMIRLQILHRIESAIYEGELPESTQMEALGNSCTSFLLGLAINRHDGISAALLIDSIRLFVNGLGFHGTRPAKMEHRVNSNLVPYVRKKISSPVSEAPYAHRRGEKCTQRIGVDD